MKMRSLAMGVAAAILAGSAHATVLDFEGLTTVNADPLNAVDAHYGGLTWDSGFYIYNQNISYAAAPHSGDYGIVNNFGGSPLIVSSSSAFTLNGLWLSGWGFNAPEAVTISGYDAAHNLVGSIKQLIEPQEGAYISVNFAGITQVEFAGGGFFAIDDFDFNRITNSVPEPGSLVLLGLGLLAVRMSRKSA